MPRERSLRLAAFGSLTIVCEPIAVSLAWNLMVDTWIKGSAESSLIVVWRHMDDEFTVSCPYCGEEVELYIEPDVRGTFVQDCEVCCNPWRVRVYQTDGERYVEVGRADGSE